MKSIFISILLLAVAFISCKKDDDKKDSNTSSTTSIEIEVIDSIEAFSSVAQIRFTGNISSVNNIGIIFSTDSAINQDTKIIYSENIDDEVALNLNELTPTTSYFAKAFVEFVDNTIIYSDVKSFNTLDAFVVCDTMQKEDYQIIVDYIKTHPDLSGYMDQTYDNSEYYYGASYHYDNFDMRVSRRRDNDPLDLLVGLGDDEVLEELWRRIYESLVILLETKYPTAQPTINGAQVYYQVTIHTYEPGNYYYFVTYKVTETGRFELFKEKVPL